jgi:hypothetical protein
MPRNSFVQTALEGGKSVASFVRIALAAWWNGDLPAHGQHPCVPSGVAGDGAHRQPQALGAFPELQRLSIHEPWLANPNVRVQRMWEHAGWGGYRYTYFILSSGHLRSTLGILLCEHELAYMRLHANYAFAAVDGTLWAGEIRDQPVRRIFVTGGIDRERHCTWSVSVVQRLRRYEMQITTGTLIPRTQDFRGLEEAMISAEEWMTEFHHRGEPVTSHGPGDAGWVM